MRTKRMRGFTLIEMMIVIFIVGCFGAVAVGACAGCSLVSAPEVQSSAEKQCRSYASTMLGQRNPTCACMGVDGDHNGYVTCQVARPGTSDGGVSHTPLQVECRANWIFSPDEGCRTPNFRGVNLNGVDNFGN